MSESDIDIGNLTEDQQLALQQFTSVTDQNLTAAVPLLRKCEWNVQIAIARFFDGEPAESSIPEQPQNVPPPQSNRRADTIAHPFAFETSYRRPSPAARFEPAPRVVSQPSSQINQQPGFILSLFLTPANLLYNLLSRVFSFVGYLFPFLPRLLSRLSSRITGPSAARTAGGRRPLGPQDTTSRFLREFQEEYGAHSLPFLETGYSRAFDLAKRELKFLVAVPLAPEHDLTASFVKDILLNDSVANYFNDPHNNVLLWAGTIQDSEPYQVATSLNLNKFPAAAVIAHTPAVSSSAMSVLTRITSPSSSEEFLVKLLATVEQHKAALDSARSSRAEQDASRNLRQQQESAYERSLAQDRERMQQKKEAQAAKAREEKARRDAEQRAERYQQNLTQWRRWRLTQMPPEPGPEVKDATRVSLRLLNGERTTRKFHPDADIEEVYALAECWEEMQGQEDSGNEKPPVAPQDFEHGYDFRLVSPMPREVYELEDGGTVKDRIGRSGNLIVERLEDDDEVLGAT